MTRDLFGVMPPVFGGFKERATGNPPSWGVPHTFTEAGSRERPKKHRTNQQ